MATENSANVNDVNSLTNQLTVARNEIHNLRQQLKALTFAHRKECEEIKTKLESWRCVGCNQMEETDNNEASLCDLPLKYIGVVHTQFPEKRATPRQTAVSAELMGKLVINNDILTNPEHALDGLQEFSHMWIIFHFHRNDSTHIRAKVAPPRLNGLRTGVFATRSPHRPSPIGLSLVKIIRVIDNVIYFSGVDMVDQTPVLDIKPYIPQYDNPTSIEQSAEHTEGPEINVNEEIPPADLNLSTRVMDGDENGGNINHSISHVNTNINLEQFYTRPASRMGEREAPDGEEDEETPRPSNSAVGEGATRAEPPLRVPSWIDDQSSHQLTVVFKDSAIAQLHQLGTAEECEEKIRTIKGILKEDPRSAYLRYRLGNNYYVFRIAALYVSCKFNDSQKSVTVFKVSQMSENND